VPGVASSLAKRLKTEKETSSIYIDKYLYVIYWSMSKVQDMNDGLFSEDAAEYTPTPLCRGTGSRSANLTTVKGNSASFSSKYCMYFCNEKKRKT
jgi:hypothetical protein